MSLSRRQFLKSSAVAGGGLVLAMHLSGCQQKPYPQSLPDDFRPNAFVQVTPSGEVFFHLHKAEMGQGVYTGLTTILAEELRVDPNNIQVLFAEVHPEFKDPEFQLMTTGGSTSVKNSYDILRRAGATAREMLVAAAAARWQTDAASLTVADGTVSGNGQTASYGELAAAARQQPVPSEPRLTDPSQFRYIGRFDKRLDARSKVDGTARFGIDVQQPDALTAVIVRCPHFGGSWKEYDAALARSVQGVQEVVELPHGIAVVADHYWSARKAADALKITWDKGPLAGVSSDTILAEQRRLMSEGEARMVEQRGEAVTGDDWIEAEYHAPYLAHATMEPQNCVADVREGRVDVWLGNQGPDTIQDAVSRALEIPREQIVVHNAMLGGGFGRRIMPDAAVEAVLISRQIQRPVQLIWSREDDTQHDFYRPAALSKFRARLDQGRVLSWQNRIVSPSLAGNLMPVFMRAAMPEWLPNGMINAVAGWMSGGSPFAVEGAADQPYQSRHFQMEHVSYDPQVPIGFWRSVGHSYNAFFVEGFVDELAHAAGADPVAFRLQNLAADAPERAVLERAAEAANWGNPPAGRHQGVAVHTSFGSTVAEVVELSVEEGRIKLHKVVCAVDCGQVINPDIVTAQVESAVVFGLTAALYGDIRIEDGAVKQSNFHDYPMLRMNEMPEIEVHILPVDRAPAGIGEPGVPPAAPALANAIFAATGQRLRNLPLKLSA